MTPSPEAGQYCKHFSQNFKDKSKACPQCCYEEAMKSRDVIARLREEAKAVDKVVEAARRLQQTHEDNKDRLENGEGRDAALAEDDALQDLDDALAAYDDRAKQENRNG